MAAKKVIRLYEENTSERVLSEVVEMLEAGAVIIFPTDTFYALGCSLGCQKAIARVKEIKRKSTDYLSLICSDLSSISNYARVDNRLFKILKNNTPGEFTFILEASSAVPNKFLERKRTVGIRVPNNSIPTQIVERLGMPLVCTTLASSIDPTSDDVSLLWDEYEMFVDAIIDGGQIAMRQSTIVDLTGDEPKVVRLGAATFINE